ncbi:MAG TPA: branched-chain amino acid ABC transporter permease [Xanthobacteraceae bacterium]|nr:branched-chain amino acid ABC transporter permease [Xanthobacteraceae bacterium]
MTTKVQSAALAVLSVVTLCVAIALPWILNSNYYLQLFVLAGINIILALGLNIVLGFAGLLALAHAGLFGIGAYASALLVMRTGISFWIALPASAAIAALFGALIGICSLRLRGHYLSIATAGFGIIIYQVFLNWISLTNGAAALGDIPPPNPIVLPGLGSITFETRISMYFLILAATVLSAVVCARIRHSRIGDALLSIREDEVAAEVMGVPVFRYKLLAFVLSAVFAGVAGSLYAHYTRIIAPEMFHLFETVTSLLMVVSGGLGSIPGVIVTSIFFTLAPEVMRELQDYRMLSYGALLVIIMIFLPEGLAGAVRQAWRRVAYLFERSKVRHGTA